MRFTTLIFILFSLGLSSGVFAQKTSDTIDLQNINYALLEELTLNHINKLRASNNLGLLLVNDTLYQAALDQTDYVVKKGKISHDQPGVEKATVKARIKLHGGGIRGMGENAAGFTILKPARIPTSQTTNAVVTIYTYADAAKTLANMWTFSPAHKQNMLYPKFDLSGLCVRIDSSSSALYAIHVLGFK